MMGYREIREVMEASSVLQGSGIKESCVQVRVCKGRLSATGGTMSALSAWWQKEVWMYTALPWMGEN